MTRSGNVRRRRNAIIEQRGLCFFCGEAMRDPEALDDRGRPHPKAATLDHLNPRLSDGRRHRSPDARTILSANGQKARNVASCRECNGLRNDEFQASLPRAILNYQSQH